MKKLFLICLISICFNACVFNKVAKEADRVIYDVDKMAKDMEDLYNEAKEMYIEKKQTVLLFQLSIYGDSGETKLWKHILKNEPKLAKELDELWQDLIKLDEELQKVDEKVSKGFLTWKDYKTAALKITKKMRDMDKIMETATSIVLEKAISKI